MGKYSPSLDITAFRAELTLCRCSHLLERIALGLGGERICLLVVDSCCPDTGFTPDMKKMHPDYCRADAPITFTLQVREYIVTWSVHFEL